MSNDGGNDSETDEEVIPRQMTENQRFLKMALDLGRILAAISLTAKAFAKVFG